MSTEKIGIIGAGVAGLSCARRLSQAGRHPVILDKGRGIGGRVSTRRTRDGLQFDHGAQYVTAQNPDFEDLLTEIRASGAADGWQDGGDRPHVVGVPGMSAMARHMGAGLEIRQNAQVTDLTETAAGWQVTIGTESHLFDRLVVTTPAPQAGALLGPDNALSAALADVAIAPCLTLMAAFGPDAPAPFTSRRDPDDPIAWISHDSSKPGRPDAACWVAQAGPDWSIRHLERDRDAIAELMLPMLCDRLGADPATARYVAGHRWRYANVTHPLGQAFLRSGAGTLYLGGDWCLGARVEAAWTSGAAIARDMLGAP